MFHLDFYVARKNAVNHYLPFSYYRIDFFAHP